MIYGYCRCSTNEKKQDIDRQVRDLKELGVERENIYLEYESGTKVDRVEFNRLLEVLKDGDTVVSTEVSRITRSTKQLIEIIELAKEKHLKLILGGFVVDCSKELDPMTEGMLKMMGVFAEMERNMISQRVKSGMSNAIEKGAVVGRPKVSIDDIPDNFKKYYDIYKKNNLKKIDLVNMSRLSRPTVDKYIKILENTEVKEIENKNTKDKVKNTKKSDNKEINAQKVNVNEIKNKKEPKEIDLDKMDNVKLNNNPIENAKILFNKKAPLNEIFPQSILSMTKKKEEKKKINFAQL